MAYLFAKVHKAQAGTVPEGKRVPFGWGAESVDINEPVVLRWGDIEPPDKTQVKLRIAIALDMREEASIEASLAETGKRVGLFDIRYASVLQPYEITLSEGDMMEAVRQGIRLRLISGSAPVWIFYDESGERREKAPLLFPHLLLKEDSSPLEQMTSFMASLSSIQAFSWLEGCVLDGLMELELWKRDGRFRETAKAHLQQFFDDKGNLFYENPRSEPVDGQVYGIEGTLPFAVFAQIDPEHPAIEGAITFWMKHLEKDGAIWDEDMLSAEGSYTIAYPMAVLAEIYGKEELAETAVKQLIARRDWLKNEEGELFLRYHRDGSRTFRHWARAHAWYLLGLIRTTAILKRIGADYKLEELEAECSHAASSALSFQTEQGLWYVFADDPSTGIETSGSAGIAAALALGANAGLLKPEAKEAARRTFETLVPYLTPDGVLGGVSQNNKAGEELQRGGYRVLSQMGTGLMAQLYAALSD